MKKKYDLNQQFFVTFAVNERDEIFKPFILNSIKNTTLGLHDTIETAPNNELSDGEISKALLTSLDSIYGSGYKCISLINWWLI